MHACDTLVIRHLSSSLSDLEKEEFLKHFGAVSVKCISSQFKKYNLVFAKFSSNSAAKSALQRLHQAEVLGTPLVVEYAREKENFEDPREKCSADKEKTVLKKKHQDFVQKLNAWHHTLQPTRPPPYHLRYEYPPATVDVLTNICRTIAVVPKLYTQVLHLMNRMNLPCPFGPMLSEPEIYVVTKQMPSTMEEGISLGGEGVQGDEETEESELEDEGEARQVDVIPMLPAKRAAGRGSTKVKRKRAFAPVQRAAPAARVPMLPEEMFEREATVAPKKIELNIAMQSKALCEEGGREEEDVSLPGFGHFPPTQKTDPDGEATEGPDEPLSATRGAITLKELRSNRIPAKDQKVLSVFKNYQIGAPSCRLYVKNIAKQVEPKHLHYIYSCFLDEKDEEQAKMFDVRLMQEGRMKGQAFITLPSIAQAKAALSETNGYILKSKPLVVQFARSAKPK